MSFLQNLDFTPIPSATNFVTFKTGAEESTQAMFNSLLDQGVIVRPLTGNAMPGFIRVSIGTHEEMDHYFNAMEGIIPSWTKNFGRPK